LYTLMSYSNGDAMAQCGARVGSAQDGSSAMYYPSTLKGADNGVCVTNADLNGATGFETGAWVFDVATAHPRAVYHDSDNPFGFNGFEYQFTESDCKALLFGMDGKWSQITLSDAF
jgi:hypothetical protein